MPAAVTCDPDTLIGYSPCTTCLSDDELMAALAALFYKLNNAGGAIDPSTLSADAACFKCMNDHELLSGLVNVLYKAALDLGYVSTGDASTVGKGLSHLPPHVVRAILLKQFCAFIDATL